MATKDKVVPMSQNGSGAAQKPLLRDEVGDLLITIYDDFQDVYLEYFRKLLRVRGLPQDPNSIQPGDPMIKWFLEQEEIKMLPEGTSQEKRQKQEAVYQELTAYYHKATDATRSDALMLTFTTDNVFENKPKNYEYPPRRTLPGIMQTPEIEHNLSNPLEYRLKQALDSFAAVDGGLEKLTSAMQQWAIQAEMEAGNRRDKDGFQPPRTD